LKHAFRVHGTAGDTGTDPSWSSGGPPRASSSTHSTADLFLEGPLITGHFGPGAWRDPYPGASPARPFSGRGTGTAFMHLGEPPSCASGPEVAARVREIVDRLAGILGVRLAEAPRPRRRARPTRNP
jgi:hypothetical protein